MRTWRRLGVGALAAFACACGSGGGSDGSDSLIGEGGLDGFWMLVISRSGIADDPRHMTLAEDGGVVDAEFTCDATLPLGTGTWDGTHLDLTFDLGGGDVVTLTGALSGWGIGGTFTAPGDAGDFFMHKKALPLDCSKACDPVEVVRFVEHDFTDLSFIEEISLFRSSAGHDYSDFCESCRSMKHYYAPFVADRVNDLIPGSSPVDGTVVQVSAEGHGASPDGENKQVRIRSSLRPDTTFILFHVDLLAVPIEPGDTVAAGEQVGTARLYYPDLLETAHDFDIGVRIHTLYGDRNVSFVETLTDAAFAPYLARGAAARSDFVITKAARDADPLTCTDETFSSTGVLPAWFVFPP